MVEVTEEEVKNSVKLIPSWTTVVRGWGMGTLILEGCGYCLGLAVLLAFEGIVGHQVSQSQYKGPWKPLLHWSLWNKVTLFSLMERPEVWEGVWQEEAVPSLPTFCELLLLVRHHTGV